MAHSQMLLKVSTAVGPLATLTDMLIKCNV